MKIHKEDFIVPEGKKVILSDWSTDIEPLYESKKEYEEKLHESTKKLKDLQALHYADNHYALLLIFQAMDAAGKDSAIKHVMSGVNPQGCQVFSFKHPSAKELEHDFLWRSTQCLPERGRIGIFNRSYYEEVLIVRVHPHILQAQGLPKEIVDEKKLWQNRYRSIVDLENHLFQNGTRIIKFFLHLSKEEQCKRFIKRIDKPEKNWKFSIYDIEERKFWSKYMEAYEKCMSATSSVIAPWYIVPADNKKNARLIISDIVVKTLESLNMSYPKASQERLQELQDIREQLSKEQALKDTEVPETNK